MLSRRHVRIKIMQALYAYQQSLGENNAGVNKDEVNFYRGLLKTSMKSFYDSYLYSLLYLREFSNYIPNYLADVQDRYLKKNDETSQLRFLYNHPFFVKLRNSEELNEKLKKAKIIWDGDEVVLRKILNDYKNSSIYKDVVILPEHLRSTQYEFLVYLFKNYITNFESLSILFEENFMGWADDRKVISDMVKKSMKKVVQDPNTDDFILPINDAPEEIEEYALELFQKTIEHEKALNKIIEPTITNYDIAQVTTIDLILLKMAVAEYKYFLSIPAVVTINEYVEIGKNYSTLQSKKFINGILDTISKDLKRV